MSFSNSLQIYGLEQGLGSHLLEYSITIRRKVPKKYRTLTGNGNTGTQVPKPIAPINSAHIFTPLCNLLEPQVHLCAQDTRALVEALAAQINTENGPDSGIWGPKSKNEGHFRALLKISGSIAYPQRV